LRLAGRTGMLRGRVLDHLGAPVTDALVSVAPDDDTLATGIQEDMLGAMGYAGVAPVATDLDGRFQIAGLAPQKYQVRAAKRGGGDAVVRGAALGREVTIKLETRSSLAGVVVGLDGRQPDSFEVELIDQERGVIRKEAFFRTGGHWSFEELSLASVRLAARSADGSGSLDVTLRSGERLTGLRIEIKPRGVVRGRLIELDSGQPLVGVTMSAAAVGGTFTMSSRDLHVTDTEGGFEVPDVPPGRFSLMFFGERGGPIDPSAIKAIAAASNETNLGDVAVVRRRAAGERRGRLGFTFSPDVADVNDSAARIAVTSVDPNGPAGDLRVGDVIAKVDGHDVSGRHAYLFPALIAVPAKTKVVIEKATGEQATIVAR
jgi:Carboxypeptidase regulatory-like domain/PDZ domain